MFLRIRGKKPNKRTDTGPERLNWTTLQSIHRLDDKTNFTAFYTLFFLLSFTVYIFSCSSLLGRIGDMQVVSLLHALGFYHEHTRSDRDQYIRVNWQNIIKYYYIDVYKKDSYNLNTKYDYSSVMHYGRTAFGITPQSETLTPIPNPNVPIGQNVGMSDIDILRVNILYKCKKYTG
uniref:Metalloendopeptidase n=1 Tax=Neolamprologus brichardi TaxID=32507 RepID=A0A3Q4N6T7_NEOBR